MEQEDIYCVLDWRNPHVYELRDLADKVIVFFYEQELTRGEKNLEEEQFIVDRVIKSRERRALISKCLLVSAVIPASLIFGFPASSLIFLRDGGETISSGISE